MLFALNAKPDGHAAPWMSFMLIFFKRIIESGFVEVVEPANQGRVYVAGLKTSPEFLVITERGRAFVRDIGAAEIG